MKHVQVRKGIWVLPVVVIALVAAHTGALYGVFSHFTWKLALGLILLVLLPLHIGVLGSIYTSFRRWLTHKP
jgi:hypothetical protein